MGNFLSLARMCTSQWLRLLFELSIERIPWSQLILVRSSQIELYKSRCADIKGSGFLLKGRILAKARSAIKGGSVAKKFKLRYHGPIEMPQKWSSKKFDITLES